MVFGKVSKGMEVVSEVEACGSSSGAPNKKVVIVDCGEL